ncbi:MAG: hypothetical protein GEU80_01895 [Dehalococcoidia bacterium]|nr:hypothetical protein [Dehalococcoidia bacterium]
MTKALRWTAGGAAMLALGAMALLAWWPGMSSAQEGDDPSATPTETAEAAPEDTGEPLFHFESDFGDGEFGLAVAGFGLGGEFALHGPIGDGEFLAGVAERLGISEDDLRAAVEAESRERLAERIQSAVDEGHLDQAEADEMLQALEDGTLDEYMQEQARERFEQHLSEAVESGRLTQEEADEMLEAFDSGERPAIPWRTGPRHHDRHGPEFRFFGFGDDAPSEEPATPSSQSSTAGGI